LKLDKSKPQQSDAALLLDVAQDMVRETKKRKAPEDAHKTKKKPKTVSGLDALLAVCLEDSSTLVQTTAADS
jgi:hypothetical protein